MLCHFMRCLKYFVVEKDFLVCIQKKKNAHLQLDGNREELMLPSSLFCYIRNVQRIQKEESLLFCIGSLAK